MKKLFVILLVTLTSGVFAQSTNKEDLDIIQGVYGKSKKELAEVYMAIPQDKAASFWKIYDDYEVERKALSRVKLLNIEKYVANFTTLDDVKADKLTKEVLKNNIDFQKLYSNYYSKYKKAVGAIVAAKIIQFEVFMQTSVQSELQDAMPVLGELEEIKK